MKAPLLVLLFLMNSLLTARAVPLADALKQKQVSAHIKTLDKSNSTVYHPDFYGECIVVEVTNLLTTPLNIELETGRFLMPDDSSLQRMMVVQPVSVTLKAKEKKKIGVQAMCTELHDSSPRATTVFALGNMAQGNLYNVAKFIAENKYQSDAGQQAVWVISDKADPAGIYSDDTVQMKSLQKYVCGLLNIPVPVVRKNLSDAFANRFRTIHVTFSYSIQRSKTVRLEVYNEKGQLLKSCVNNEQQAAGDYTYESEFTVPVNNPSQTDRQIILKFYLNGELATTSRHTIPNK